MKRVKNIITIIFISMLLSTKAISAEAWINDSRTIFAANKAIIYALNLRTFNSFDKNGNGIIEEELGEERGTFLNAINRLDELSEMGINTIHVLPITPSGKIKALGTAGSLYAASSFSELNPQLKSKNSSMSVENEAILFINECHKRKIRVIIDLPSCGSYDLYLQRPELFIKDKSQNPVIPADWTDVRLLNAGVEGKINYDVYKLYKDFVDLMLSLGADGIRADVATIKPYDFWAKLIEETRKKDPQFLFLAEASESWKEPPSEYAVFTPYNKLLEAGFDGYYGSYFNLKNWKNGQDLISQVKFNVDLAKKYSNTKSVIGSFSTHDELSPVLINGEKFSEMIIWLNSTLPINAYYVDGFATGDKYLYPLANKKASKTYTDDEYYFMHRGKLDIFNFSSKPQGSSTELPKEFVYANRFRISVSEIVSKGDFKPLKTNSKNVFAFSRNLNNASIIVIGNINFASATSAEVYIPGINDEMMSIPVKIRNVPKISKNKITTNLFPGEIQVILFNTFTKK